MAGEENVYSVEEPLKRTVTRGVREASSRGHDQPVIAIEEIQTVSSSVDEKARTLSNKERFEMLIKAGTDTTQAQTTTFSKIQKVPSLLREHTNFEKYYEPRVVSIGPIHHGNPKFQAAEKYKLRWAYKFFQESGKPQLEDLHWVVMEKIKELSECFEEAVTKSYDDDALAWILFVDGCAMLQFLYCRFYGERFKDLGIKYDSVAFGQQDMFLLENQLPYCLLEWLMGCSKNEIDLRKSINTFINSNIKAPPREHWIRRLFRCLKREKSNEGENATHSQPKSSPEHSVPIEGENEHSQPKSSPEISVSIEEESSESEPTHLLDLLRKRLLGRPKKESPVTTEEKEQYWQSYRNVLELRAVGIRLKPSKETSTLRNISFTRSIKFRLGNLNLPRITVDDSTGSKFMNLIAYEMCPDFENDFGVTSYVSFLDSLIDQPIDVQELRKAGILYNFLGSDKEVAQLFNEIGTDLVPNPDAYKDVKVQIQKYYRNKGMTWINEFLHNHFSSPWTFLAFLGALLALGLSALQTWYSIK